MILTQTGIAYGAVDGYVVKNQSGVVFLYDLNELKAALTNSLIYGEDSDEAKLWKHFSEARVSPGQIIALHDDTTGFVDFDAVKAALLESILNGTSFNVDDYTESSSAVKPSDLPAVLKKVALVNGAIVLTDSDNESSLPSFTLTATNSGLLGAKTVSVTLVNTQNDTNFTVTVDGTELTYSATNDQFVGVLQTTKSQDELKALTVVKASDFTVISIE